ncbi:MAG: HNH endonuclease [Dehalococcoidia bacterium]|jgi:hypothetical protein
MLFRKRASAEDEERKKAYQKKWRAAHPGHGTITSREWKRKHPGRCKQCGKKIDTYANYCPAHKGVLGRNPNWKGGRAKHSAGYIKILIPNHPHACSRGYVLEHRLVMEAHLGRTLLPTEIVHHINGMPGDNRIENLMLFHGVGEHVSYHSSMKRGEKNV